MRHNLLKPSPFPSWIWNTPLTCLSLSLSGLFSRLVQVPLYRQPNTLGWAGLDSQLPEFHPFRWRNYPHSPPSSTFFHTFSLPRSRHSSNITYLMTNSVTTLHALITSNPTIFFLEPRLNPWVTPMIEISLRQSPSTPLAQRSPWTPLPLTSRTLLPFSSLRHRSLIHALVAPNRHFPALLNAFFCSTLLRCDLHTKKISGERPAVSIS